ncbi:DUF4184 family protein [Actinokineospora sp. HUAS TT18]|uniref:DUF4184 family protein n=1 Tax=Actinokineospora sp. HUAS TT18 TaxID=3447451 RepID=UPI003F527FEE
MPFTLAHPAAILPFARTNLPTSALVTGAMAPDLFHFTGIPDTGFTHTFPGLILTIPIALTMAAIWHQYAQHAALAISTREFKKTKFPKLIPATAAAAAGITTHVVWDAFTHGHGFVVARIPMLRRQIWPDMPLFFFLQVAFSFIGAALLLHHLTKNSRTLPRKPPTKPLAAIVLTCTTAFAWIAATQATAARPDLAAEVAVVRGAVGATSGFATGLIICGLVLRRGSFRSVTQRP